MSEITFRKIDKEDLPNLLRLKLESWFGTHRISFVNSLDQEKYLEKLSSQDIHTPKDLVLAALTKLDTRYDVPIGIFKILNIDWISRRAEVGWDIFDLHRKKGFGKKLVCAGAKYCFDMLNLRRLDAQILETNVASIKCATTAGFKLEGRQNSVIYKAGRYVNNLLYGLLREVTCP